MLKSQKLNQMHYFVKVLVIDDIFYVKKTISSTLTKAGFFVLTASSCSEAMEKITKYSPDLIIVSHKLRDMPGKLFVKEFKNNYRGNDIKLLFLTNIKDKDRVQAQLSNYIDNFISKPVNKNQLIATVKSLFPPPT